MIIVDRIIKLEELPSIENDMFFNEDEMVKAVADPVAREKIKDLVEKWIRI